MQAADLVILVMIPGLALWHRRNVKLKRRIARVYPSTSRYWILSDDFSALRRMRDEAKTPRERETCDELLRSLYLSIWLGLAGLVFFAITSSLARRLDSAG
jgi:hypothetical protein